MAYPHAVDTSLNKKVVYVKVFQYRTCRSRAQSYHFHSKRMEAVVPFFV